MSDEPKAETYHAQAIADASSATQGRFAAVSPRPRVNGTAPTVEPLPVPEWSQGPQPPDEPPLGYAVDDMEPS
jgi:hypothetical protein